MRSAHILRAGAVAAVCLSIGTIAPSGFAQPLPPPTDGNGSGSGVSTIGPIANVGALTVQQATTVTIVGPGDKDEAEDEGNDEEKEKQLDEESFPLLKRGIVVGAGVAVHAFGFDVDKTRPILKGAATTGFAYLGLMPGYWRTNREETDAYCASYETKVALARADAVAVNRTIATLKESKYLVDKTMVTEMAKEVAKKTPPTKLPQPQKDKIKALRDWEVGVPARCGARRFGFFIALPAGFKADVESSEIASRDVEPLGSAGLIFAPRSYLQFLLGITVSNVALPSMVGAASDDVERNQRMYSVFIGVGTPFDSIGGLFK